MRIVAGQLGGRRIHAPRTGLVRPTSDRVREALFSILGDVSGLTVLDLFCGTGALGIEALSRGASHATFVDTVVGAVVRNIGDLGLRERSELVRGDALRFLERDGPAFDLILCDPPYRVAPRLGPDLDRFLVPRIGEDGRVIVETAADQPMNLPSLPLLDERTYGSTLIRIHGAPEGRA
jgi:16S rRNA (guanine966-N2)-methyltransferase